MMLAFPGVCNWCLNGSTLKGGRERAGEARSQRARAGQLFPAGSSAGGGVEAWRLSAGVGPVTGSRLIARRQPGQVGPMFRRPKALECGRFCCLCLVCGGVAQNGAAVGLSTSRPVGAHRAHWLPPRSAAHELSTRHLTGNPVFSYIQPEFRHSVCMWHYAEQATARVRASEPAIGAKPTQAHASPRKPAPPATGTRSRARSLPPHAPKFGTRATHWNLLRLAIRPGLHALADRRATRRVAAHCVPAFLAVRGRRHATGYRMSSATFWISCCFAQVMVVVRCGSLGRAACPAGLGYAPA